MQRTFSLVSKKPCIDVAANIHIILQLPMRVEKRIVTNFLASYLSLKCKSSTPLAFFVRQATIRHCGKVGKSCTIISICCNC